MNKKLSKLLQITIPLALGIFLIWYSYNSFTTEQLANIKLNFRAANYGFVVLSVVLSLLSHLSRTYRWNFMLEPLGYKPKLANNFMAIAAAYLMNIFIPKSGEVGRAMILDKYEHVPFQKGFGTIITERVIDLIFLLAFTAAALIIKFDELSNYLSENVPVAALYGIAVIVIIIFLVFPIFLKYSKSALNVKLRNFLLGLKEGLLSIVKMKKKKAFIIHSFIIWGLYLASFYAASFALDETSTISFSTLIIAFVVGSFTFAFTNSGFGTYPAAIAGILFIFGISQTVGTAFGWIIWTSNIASIIIIGGLSLLILPLYNRNKR